MRDVQVLLEYKYINIFLTAQISFSKQHYIGVAIGRKSSEASPATLTA